MKSPDPLLRVKDAELSEWVDRINLILNSGKYETRVLNTEATEATLANEGESYIYASDDGTIRKLKFYINGVWATINFTSSGAVSAGGFGDRILDDDGNTGIFTQFTSNEDRLRHYSNGSYVMAVDTYGIQVAPTYKVVFDGLGGDTYWTYSSASSYMQCYLNGTLRMEM